MIKTLVSLALGVALATAVACSDSKSATPDASMPATAGTLAGTSAAGTTAGSGGMSGSGSGAGASGSNAADDAGQLDSSVALDASHDASAIDAAVRPPKPSAGCGMQNPVTGDRTITTGGEMGTFKVHLPASYDANTPMPLGLGFHGFNNPACLPTAGGECKGFPELGAITVYPKSFTQGWEQDGAREKNLKFFEDLVALMKNEYCVDENRIFVAGVSSGGQFVEYLACLYGDWLWQVTPVSAGVVGAADKNCKGTPPILVIHGVTDMVGNYGQGTAEMFARRNGCSMDPPAGLAQAKIDMMKAFDAKLDDHVCLDWDGCTANPVRFCISSQITYSGLTHGWPKIGGMLISDFQATLE